MSEGEVQFDPLAASGDDFLKLVVLHLEGRLAGPRRDRLNSLLAEEPGKRDTFVAVCTHASLLASCVGFDEERGDSGFGIRNSGFGVRGSENAVGAAVELPYQLDTEIPGAEPLVPPAIILSPLPSPLSSPSSFVGGLVFSYMVATVILGMMLLGAWAYKITHYNQIAEAPSPAVSSSNRLALVFVGRITGMADCRWADPQTEAYAGASVPLGRKYALASGLMQITYDSGAKVILEGPCTYEVEFDNGGYLSLGKLTAKIEERKEKREERAKPPAANQKSPVPRPPSPAPLFSVRTPTAIVTDLGTEFGVEVGKEGNTTSHVFRGSVKVQVVASERGTGPICRNGPEGASHKLDLSPFPTQSIVLRANESARVEKGEGKEGNRLVLEVEATGAAPKFVRRLYEPPKLLDLLDVVAGGSGRGQRRECGIDPLSGRMVPRFIERSYAAGRQYWYVPWNRLIDGVFVPDGGAGKVQVDSAGHAFDAFPQTDGWTYGSIWSRAADIDPKEFRKDNPQWMYLIGRCEQFMPEGRGLLCLHPNAGITFDLAAMRRSNPGASPGGFRAIAGMVDSRQWNPKIDDNISDVWVLVDGRLKLKREKLRPQDGTVKVEVPLQPSDRFLTLVATDGGDGDSWDWVVFGDPLLEMTSIEEKESGS